jgi:hypothetical protein
MGSAAKETAVSAVDIEKALADRCAMHTPPQFFLTQVKNGPTQYVPSGNLLVLDALSIAKSWTQPCLTGYEIKVSRGDFLRDSKWYQYFPYVHEFYLVCPSGLIDRTEIPLECGLIYYRPESHSVTTKKKAIYRDVTLSADMLMYIIMSKLDSDRIPFFSSRQLWVEEYLKNKSSAAMLGRSLAAKLPQRLAELEDEIAILHRTKTAVDELKAIRAVCEKHGIWSSDPAALDKALTRPFPKEVERIEANIRGILNIIEDMRKGEPEEEK